ncbi:hypothetical protein PO909_026915 [Leuciscus waleckii]
MPSFPALPERTPQSWPILTLINTSLAGNGNRAVSQDRPPSEPLSGIFFAMHSGILNRPQNAAFAANIT